ncbi:MAG TPA: 5'-3' exonuclease H3TH domain-containing protein, partial [Victivallales bacterium]|nr:5'-3' exonuclease H3TH domain-containing protein [Victivallales bacterium]
MADLILIDSFAHIYRGFYALPPLTNSSGILTNAIFAFSKTLLMIEKNFPSNYGAVIFDKGKSTKRLEISPEYKATRPPTPPDLLQQLPYIKEIAKAFGWKIIEFDNTEADDIIASICQKFNEKKIYIVSNDKDLAQLVNDNILMLVSSKDGGLSEMNKDGVFVKFAVYPEQIVDYLSLIGDNSDNIRGASGIGPKTASKLLAEYRNIESLLSNISSIKSEKVKNSIISSAEQLKKNKTLIKLPISNTASNLQFDELKKEKADFEKISEICRKLELKSILQEF